jgi:glycerate kinase
MVQQLEENLAHFAAIIERDLGVHIQDIPGTGAAGGLSAGLMAVAGAELVSGVQELIKACGYDERLAQGDIDLVITGEGKLDSQTVGGKAPLGIAKEAAKHHIPVVALAGAVTTPIEQLLEWGIQAVWSIIREPCTLDEALANTDDWLVEAATNLGNLLALANH